jgi:hypothetical protein
MYLVLSADDVATKNEAYKVQCLRVSNTTQRLHERKAEREILSLVGSHAKECLRVSNTTQRLHERKAERETF